MSDAIDPLAAGGVAPAWSFTTEAVAAAFDGHVASQLPWYRDLSAYVAEMAASFLPRRGLVYDVGASTGNITRMLEGEIAAKEATAISIEPSAAMATRFAGNGKLIQTSAEMVNFSHDRPNVIVCFLTLMFVSPAWRFDIVRRMRDALLPGGAMIIVDKSVIDQPRLQVACKAAQLAGKLRAGTTPDAYTAKELALRGTQFPIDRTLLSNTLIDGDCSPEEFFRWGEFFGIAAIKDES